MSDELASLLLLSGAAVASYVAVRAATNALIPADHAAPTKRAIIHSAMTAMIAVMAICHRPALLDVSVGVPFAAAVGAMTLALGVVLFVTVPTSSSRGFNPRPLNSHGTWAFLLPTALLTLLIGFSGQLTLRSGFVLVAEGAAIFLVLRGARSRVNDAFNSPLEVASTGRRRPKARHRFALAQAIVASAVGMIACWCMVQGTAGLVLQSPVFRPGVAAVLALGPAIVLPMIPPLATLAERGRRDEAMSTLIGFALINLCVVLPIVIIAQRLLGQTTAATQPSAATSLAFPILIWRLDTVLLVTVGMLILPAAVGRWTMSRIEGLGLIAIYIAYLFITLVIARN